MITGHLTLITPTLEKLNFGDPCSELQAVMIILDWRACGRIISAGDIGFAEAYRRGWIDSPHLTSLLQIAIRNESAMKRAIDGGCLSTLWYSVLHRLRPNTKSGSRRNIFKHYDVGNEFYRRWLDPSWTYSSAWFAGDFSQSLENAQNAKYQRIIERLDLKPGMRILEIGCGWGGFAIHAATLGIQVHGITVSPAQLRLAAERVREHGFNHLVTLELRDYRDLDAKYDAIVSIEMFEAVGEKFWPSYFEALRNHLVPGGKALIQSIVINENSFKRYRAVSDFIREYVFPGGMLPSQSKFIESAGKFGLKTREICAFGQDYAETLRRWRHQFEEQLQEIRLQDFDEKFIKTWRLYLTYCEAGFKEDRTDVCHFLLERLA